PFPHTDSSLDPGFGVNGVAATASHFVGKFLARSCAVQRNSARQMKAWKIALFVAALAALLWWLDPGRALSPNELGVVEINYTDDAGTNNQVMDDAFRAFEAESR